jgi:hypothetical protein
MSSGGNNNTNKQQAEIEIGLPGTVQEDQADSVNTGMIYHIQNQYEVDQVTTPYTMARQSNATSTNQLVAAIFLLRNGNSMTENTTPNMPHHLDGITRNVAMEAMEDLPRLAGASNTIPWAGAAPFPLDTQQPTGSVSSESASMVTPIILESRRLQGYTANLLSMRFVHRPRQEVGNGNMGIFAQNQGTLGRVFKTSSVSSDEL